MKTNASNEITLKFPSRSCNEGFARTAIACFATQLDPTLNELEDIKTSISEAVTNAIVHGYREKEGKIYITVSIFENNIIRIKIRDKGVGIEDIEKGYGTTVYYRHGSESLRYGFYRDGKLYR